MGYSQGNVGYAPYPPAGCELELEVKVKDPAVKGNVLYDVPLSKISQTQGLKEYLENRQRDAEGGERRPHVHRSCICKLWLDGRCGQGSKCKSFHVDAATVQQMRAQRNVEYDDSFLSELIVRHASGAVFAVRYTAVCKTKGLEMYKTEKRFTTPAQLCPDFNPISGREGHCANDRACKLIHVKAGELKELAEGRQRTPCCMFHGDEPIATFPARHPLYLNGRLIPADRIAPSAALHRLRAGQALTLDHVCSIHVKSRCKFGRSCVKLHVCRKWMMDPDGEEARGVETPPRGTLYAPRPLSLDRDLSNSARSTPQPTPVHTPKIFPFPLVPLVLPDGGTHHMLCTAGSWSSVAGSSTPSPGYRTTSERSDSDAFSSQHLAFPAAIHPFAQRFDWGSADAQLLDPSQAGALFGMGMGLGMVPPHQHLQQRRPQSEPRRSSSDFSLSASLPHPAQTPPRGGLPMHVSAPGSADSSLMDTELITRAFAWKDFEAVDVAPSPPASHTSAPVEAPCAMLRADEGLSWSALQEGGDVEALPPLVQEDAPVLFNPLAGLDGDAFEIPAWDPDTDLTPGTPLMN